MIIKNHNYDGDLIHKRFAYNFFRKKTLPIGNIIAFRGYMNVDVDGMSAEKIIKYYHES